MRKGEGEPGDDARANPPAILRQIACFALEIASFVCDSATVAVLIKGIVSLYKGRVLLFLKTFEINRKT